MRNRVTALVECVLCGHHTTHNEQCMQHRRVAATQRTLYLHAVQLLLLYSGIFWAAMLLCGMLGAQKATDKNSKHPKRVVFSVRWVSTKHMSCGFRYATP